MNTYTEIQTSPTNRIITSADGRIITSVLVSPGHISICTITICQTNGTIVTISEVLYGDNFLITNSQIKVNINPDLRNYQNR